MALKHRGVKRGDRVAIMISNCPEWVALFFGISRIGAVAVTVNTAYRGEGLAYLLADSAPTLIAVDAELLPRFAALENAALPPLIVRDALLARTATGSLASLFADHAGTLPPLDLKPSNSLSERV